MRKRRRFPIWLSVLLILAAVAVVVFLRKQAPPEPARLLPGADGYAYINLKWIRRANFTGQLPEVSHDPEYEQFIQETGFQFERDLDRAAIAIHYPESLPASGGVQPTEARFSEVFEGTINGQKLRAYLHKIATSVEEYKSSEIYSIPMQGRTVRVAPISVDTVAVSNHPDPQVIRGIVDRSRKLASPFGGPQLLRQYYKHVPLASLAWVIFKTGPGSGDFAPGPLNFSFLFEKPAVVVGSARYLGSLHLRAAAYTSSAEDAKNIADKINTFFSLFHSAETSVSAAGPDAEIKQFFDSLKIERSGDRAILTAVVPLGLIKKALAEPPTVMPPAETAVPAPQPKSKSEPKHARRVK